MSEPYKLVVKIGTSEFSAEGDHKTVHDQYQLFLTALKYTAGHDRKHVEEGKEEHPGGRGTQGESEKPPAVTSLVHEPPKATMDRVFKVDAQDVVSLNALPKEGSINADALVMLLYGYLKLTQKSPVNGITLMRGAQQSGLQIDRIDRVILPNQQYINKAGSKRATRYALNNRGEVYAVQLIQKVLA